MKRPLAVLLAAVLLAGCGGDDDDQGPVAATGTATAPAGAAVTFADIPRLVQQLEGSIVTVRTGRGEGSGVVWSEDVVITNQHVVAGAQRVELVLATGREVQAEVLAAERRFDIAVLRTSGGDLPPAPFADDLPQVGELAVALGNPLGFENSVTVGVVSGLDRSIPSGGRTPALVGLLQTDAAISPGNSGGALVGAGGEVIGLNVAYIPPQARAVALGFAIPAPTVRRVVTALLEDGTVEEPFLGVQLVPLRPRVADQLGVDVQRGAIVAVVEPGEPAARAGLRQGDVIVRLGERDVESVEDVYAALRELQPGDEVAIEVVRESGRETITVELSARPSDRG